MAGPLPSSFPRRHGRRVQSRTASQPLPSPAQRIATSTSSLGAARPRLVGEFTYGAIVRDEHGMTGTEERGVQVDAAAVHDSNHSPVAPASLSVIFVHDGLGADR